MPPIIVLAIIMSVEDKYITFVEKIVECITCPIFKMIMFDPVKACDGIAYERTAIERWFEKNNSSPMTGAQINKQLIPCINLKNIISEVLVLQPNLKSEQYEPDLIDYQLKKNDIQTLLIFKQYNKLKNYTNFHLESFFLLVDVKIFLNFIPEDVQKHIIDNSHDLNVSIMKGSKLIHQVALFGSVEIFKFLVSKDIDLICKKINNSTLTHYICNNCSDDIVKYFIDLNINLESEDSSGNRPIHLLIKNSNISNETIIYFIEKGINLECPNEEGKYPIHLACDDENYREALIMYMWSKNINLECCDDDNWRPIHYLCNGSHKVLIKELIDKNVMLDCETNCGKKPIHLLAKPSTITMLQYLLQKNVQVTDLIENSDSDNNSDN